MEGLPEPSTMVLWGKTRYIVVRHGCSTGMRNCANGERAITLLLPGKGIGWSVCVSADKVEPVLD